MASSSPKRATSSASSLKVGIAEPLLSARRIAGHVAESPIEHLALSLEFSSRCYDDFGLLRTLRTQRSASALSTSSSSSPRAAASSLALSGKQQQLAPSASAIQTASEAIFFPAVVRELLPMLHMLPTSGYELLLLLSRYYSGAEAKDANSLVGRQMAVLLDRAQQQSAEEDAAFDGCRGAATAPAASSPNALTSKSSSSNTATAVSSAVTLPTASKALAQVRFVANAALIDSADDKRAALLEAEVAAHVDLIPISILETLLTVATPRLCRFFLEHTLDRIAGPDPLANDNGGTGAVLPSSNSAASARSGSGNSGGGKGYDATYVFTLWGALLANDAFFNPLHFDAMHECLLLLVRRAPLGSLRSGATGGGGVSPSLGGGSSTGSSSTASMVPVLNKSSRVYSLCLRGRQMMALHTAFFGARPEGLRLMPWAYFTRLIGSIYDDVAAAHELSLGGISATEEAAAWEGQLMPLARRFLSFFSTDERAVETLWRITFKAALLFPSATAAHVRAAEAYALFIDCGVPREMSKDQFAQLLRLYCEAIAAGEGPRGEGPVVSLAYSSYGAMGGNPSADGISSFVSVGEAHALEWERQLALLGRVLSGSPSATMHWGMNALDALLLSLCQCPPPPPPKDNTVAIKAGASEPPAAPATEKATDAATASFASPHVAGLTREAKAKLGSQLLAWLTNDFFAAKRVAATDPLNVSTIRRSLEALGAIEQSPFWWTCGCTALNSSHSDVCGKCMRNDRARWRCSNERCGALQFGDSSGGGGGGGGGAASGSSSSASSPAFACGQCGTPHPLVVAAEVADVPLCHQCIVRPLSEDLLCGVCDEAALSASGLPPGRRGGRVEEQRGSANNSKNGNIDAAEGSPNLFSCGNCGHAHSSRVVCPKCGVKTKAEEQLGMWLCEDCGSYSYLFNKRCARCASAAAAGRGRGGGSGNNGGIGRVRELTTGTFRTGYQPWVCGCGGLNPMVRLGCGWCGESRRYTCPSCDRSTAFDATGKGATIRIATAATSKSGVALPTSLCEHCGDVHPRDATVLEGCAALVDCYNCGGRCVVGEANCKHCDAALEGFNPLLPFWCESCVEGSKQAQSGFACAHCKSPRSEIADCSYLWRCIPRVGADYADEAEEGATASSPAAACSHWNPSWASACEACGQSRVYDSEHEVRARHCGQWECGACGGTNEPGQVLICAHCDDGLHVPPPCKDCGRPHIAMACPSEDLLAQAADILDGLQADEALL